MWPQTTRRHSSLCISVTHHVPQWLTVAENLLFVGQWSLAAAARLPGYHHHSHHPAVLAVALSEHQHSLPTCCQHQALWLGISAPSYAFYQTLLLSAAPANKRQRVVWKKL